MLKKSEKQNSQKAKIKFKKRGDYGQTDGLTAGRTDERMDGKIDRWTNMVTYKIACARLKKLRVVKRDYVDHRNDRVLKRHTVLKC